MYKRYYGLTKKPFDLMPAPDTVYKSEAHLEALSILRYGVLERKGFLLLTGDVGTGKTTLLQLLVKSMGEKVHLCMITNPALSIDDFYYYLSAKYGLKEYTGNKAKFILEFAAFLEKCREQKERVLLIIDEAHVAPVNLLDEIRLLSNQHYQEFGVLSIFLVGQPELNERLALDRLLPLRQRIAIRFHLDSFGENDTGKYILFRLGKAGAQSMTLFTEEAISMIHAETRGVPRLINVVCDQALLTGFAEGAPLIDAAIIRECISDIHIPGENGSLALPELKGNNEAWTLIKEKLIPAALYSLILLALVVVSAQIYQDAAPHYWPGHEWITNVKKQALNIGGQYFGKSI